MFDKTFAKPRFRPTVNVGCLMDIPTGQFEKGARGEYICNGGLSGFTGICSRPNNFKTALAVYMMAMVRRSLHNAFGISYDTEGTLYPENRFNSVSRNEPHLAGIDWTNDTQYSFTDLSQYSGDVWFEQFRKTVNEKTKNEKDYTCTTPFIDIKNNNKQSLYPTVALIDSFSKFQVSAVETIYDKNSIGDSGANTDAMMNGKAKNQMLNQIPQICARTGTYMIMTAHLGDVINMEMFPTDKRNLSYMKKDTVLKGVSSGFYSLPHNVWMITHNKPLQNKDKMPEYPWDNSTAIQGDTDLAVITMINLRGKNGISGFPIDIVVSQSEGVLASLTEFHYCKSNDRFGIGGNMQNYYMELCPDVGLSRTKVRQKLNESAQLRRAVSITADLLQLIQFHRIREPEGILCDPKTLYEDLKAQGHDWNVLLNTRSYWVPEEETNLHPEPYLSIMDLLNMRLGTYVPYWYTKEQKAAIKPPVAKTA